MSKITLDVKPENLKTVLTILENLKVGLVENIKVRQEQYKVSAKNKQSHKRKSTSKWKVHRPGKF